MKHLLFILILVASMASAQTQKFETNILHDYFQITKNSQSDYPIKDIIQGCSKVDCIPSIDAPEFIPAAKIDFLKDTDLILAVTLEGETRVYPAVTLQLHEIVNDRIGKTPFSVTYCPLCGTGMVFLRQVNGTTVEFGVSGVLHGSDLVLYDRTNKNLWQQITGQAFAGPDRGYQLENIPVVMTDWKTWFKQHPQSQVLSNSKDQIKDRYQTYRNSDQVMFGGQTDSRLNPKRVIYGLTIGEQAVAIDFKMIQLKKEFILKANGTELMIQYSQDGTVAIKNNLTDQIYKSHRSYWFAWYTFNPNTLIFK